MRTAKLSRKTKETDITLSLCLDGGEVEINTGVGFFDHMLTAFALHGGLGLEIKAIGDIKVDAHHTVEDVGIVLGSAFSQALGDKTGIARFGNAFIPMDEALSAAIIDVSARPFLVFSASFEQEKVGEFDTCLCEEFFRAFSTNAGITLHASVLYGNNAHHQIEALFKAVAHALKTAISQNGTQLLSTKGTL